MSCSHLPALSFPPVHISIPASFCFLTLRKKTCFRMSQNRQCPLCTQALEDFLFSVPGARSLRQLCEKFPFPKTSLYITCRTEHIIFHFKILSVFYLLPESWQSVQQKRTFLVGKMCTKRKRRRGQIHSQTHLPGYDWTGALKAALGLIW